MGRDAGFIAANATLASADVNFCLIPEVPFELGGPMGLLAVLHRRLLARGHALIVIGEGCGATLAKAENAERDASGNIRYASQGIDVGPRIRDAIIAHFGSLKFPVNVKYIDPELHAPRRARQRRRRDSATRWRGTPSTPAWPARPTW